MNQVLSSDQTLFLGIFCKHPVILFYTYISLVIYNSLITTESTLLQYHQYVLLPEQNVVTYDSRITVLQTINEILPSRGFFMYTLVCMCKRVYMYVCVYVST